MVLLEIAALITAGIGLADYRHTKIYNEKLRQLKEKYGEHPNIDDAFEDICILGGEYFKMPELDLESKHPDIIMGSFYQQGANGPASVLEEFFTTMDDKDYFFKKYDKERKRQAKLRNKALSEMYNTIMPLYKKGDLKSIGSTPMNSNIYQAPYMLAKNLSHYEEMLNYISNQTIWGEIFDIRGGSFGYEYKYSSKWIIKEEILNKIHNKEAYDILFKCCYFHLKDRYW